MRPRWLARKGRLRHIGGMATAPRRIPDRTLDGRSDRRWIVLAEDGRYVTLSRELNPSEDDILRAEDSLRKLDAAGWLVVMSGSAYAPEMPTVLEVRRLASPTRPFAEAVDAMMSAIEEDRRQDDRPPP